MNTSASHEEALNDLIIAGKQVCIFENHAHAILPWARWRKNFKPLVLLSFDHHSDTNSCYLRSLFKQVGRDLEAMEAMRTERIKQVDYKDEQQLITALEGLYHDEHIHAALRLGIIDAAFIIQHSFDTIHSSLAEKNMFVLPTEINLEETPASEKQAYFDRVLDSSTIDLQLKSWESEPFHFSIEHTDYILDIDLDVFKSKKSIQPDCSKTFQKLFKHATGISIARESEWIQRLTGDSDLNSDFFQKQLIHIFESSS